MYREERNYREIYGEIVIPQIVPIISNDLSIHSSPIKEQLNRTIFPNRIDIPSNDWNGRIAYIKQRMQGEPVGRRERERKDMKKINMKLGVDITITKSRSRNKHSKNENNDRKGFDTTNSMDSSMSMSNASQQALYSFKINENYKATLMERSDNLYHDYCCNGLVNEKLEYEMDEQDLEWCKLTGIKDYYLFIHVMSTIEYEWNLLSKPFQSIHNKLKEEGKVVINTSMGTEGDNNKRKKGNIFFVCNICDTDSSSGNNSTIVICEDCELAVHQDCYGIISIPEGPWLCRPCYAASDTLMPVKCAICLQKEGAMKPTTDPHKPWAHIFCAKFLHEEVKILNSFLKEPIDLKNINSQRWKMKCQKCGLIGGAPIQCRERGCKIFLHPTCLSKDTLQDHHVYCGKHAIMNSQSSTRKKEKKRKAPQSPSIMTKSDNDKNEKIKEKLRKFLRNPRVSKYVVRINFPPSLPFVDLICKYWTLKKCAKRGVNLYHHDDRSYDFHDKDNIVSSSLHSPYPENYFYHDYHHFKNNPSHSPILIQNLSILTNLLCLLSQKARHERALVYTKIELFELLTKPFNSITMLLLNQLERNYPKLKSSISNIRNRLNIDTRTNVKNVKKTNSTTINTNLFEKKKDDHKNDKKYLDNDNSHVNDIKNEMSKLSANHRGVNLIISRWRESLRKFAIKNDREMIPYLFNELF